MQATDTHKPMMTPPALAVWLRLQQADGVGLLTAHKLLRHFHTPQAIFAAERAALLKLLTSSQAEALLRAAPDPAMLDALLAWQEQAGHRLLALDHPDYPEALANIPAPPLLLFVKGRAELLPKMSVAMVGARNASNHGVQNAEHMAQALSEAGLTIVSGLALGIDAASHAGGLNGDGGTIAVIGTGIDRIYPSRNQQLARRVAEEGCIVSEYPLGTPPTRDNFPRRNRIIAGLARGVLVVEAAAQSGSLITARLAASYGREVYAIPGSIHATLSKGCHRLIREGARLVESAADILSDMKLLAAGQAGVPSLPDDSFVDRVLDAMGGDPIHAEQLAARLNQPAAELQGQLLALELAGLLERLPGGIFQRLRV